MTKILWVLTRPGLNGALFLSLRLTNSSTDCFTLFAMTEKSGSGRRIKAPK